MASLTIRSPDPATNQTLRAWVRHATPVREVNLAEANRRRFAPSGGIDDLPIC